MVASPGSCAYALDPNPLATVAETITVKTKHGGANILSLNNVPPREDNTEYGNATLIQRFHRQTHRGPPDVHDRPRRILVPNLSECSKCQDVEPNASQQ